MLLSGLGIDVALDLAFEIEEGGCKADSQWRDIIHESDDVMTNVLGDPTIVPEDKLEGALAIARILARRVLQLEAVSSLILSLSRIAYDIL